MAMKKADMEAHWSRYQDQIARARTAERRGLIKEALACALASWNHIDGMMQYGRRHKDVEFDSIEGIDMVLAYAPYLLDFRSLDRLEELLRAQRSIDKNTSKSMAGKLADAREQLRQAYRLWDQIEQEGAMPEDQLCDGHGARRKLWTSIIKKWEAMGLLTRVTEGDSVRLNLATRMGAIVPAKCPCCGTVTEAPKAMLLEPLTCPSCRQPSLFVFLPAVDPALNGD